MITLDDAMLMTSATGNVIEDIPDIDTFSYDTKSYAGQGTDSNGVNIIESTNKLLELDVNDTVYQHSMPDLDDVSTASYDTKSKSFVAQETIANGIYIVYSENKLFLLGSQDDEVNQYSMPDFDDVTTLSFDSKLEDITSSGAVVPEGIFIIESVNKVFIPCSGSEKIYQYSMSDLGDIGTMSYDSKSLVIASADTSVDDIYILPDINKLYIVGSTSDKVHQYSMPDLDDITTATADTKTLSIATQEASVGGLTILASVDKVFVNGKNETIYQYGV